MSLEQLELPIEPDHHEEEDVHEKGEARERVFQTSRGEVTVSGKDFERMKKRARILQREYPKWKKHRAAEDAVAEVLGSHPFKEEVRVIADDLVSELIHDLANSLEKRAEIKSKRSGVPLTPLPEGRITLDHLRSPRLSESEKQGEPRKEVPPSPRTSGPHKIVDPDRERYIDEVTERFNR